MHDINNLVLVWFENNVVGLPNLLHQTECLSQRLLNVRLHFEMNIKTFDNQTIKNYNNIVGLRKHLTTVHDQGWINNSKGENRCT